MRYVFPIFVLAAACAVPAALLQVEAEEAQRGVKADRKPAAKDKPGPAKAKPAAKPEKK